MKPAIIPAPRKIIYTGGHTNIACADVSVSMDKSIPAEGYRITISDGKIHIIFSDESGRYYAEKTLLQISDTCGCVCDNLDIEDYPEFAYRGFSLDCVRHIFAIEDIKKIIDTAALFKLNEFHWHLTDDQGWRIQIDSFPQLTETGSIRKDSTFRSLDEHGEYGGFYTKDEIREIVSYCAERHIEVIPEIEMPGHTTAILASYPGLGCTGEKVDLQTKEGIFDTVLCLGNPEIYNLIFAVIDEICELFPGRFIHIGGDETPRTQWKKCPKCKAEMQRLGLVNYDKFQGQFIKKVAGYIKAKGKTAITWNESLKGNMLSSDEVMVQFWMGNKELTDEFGRKGGRIIQSDFYHYYCDYPYAMTPVRKTYNFNPYSACGDKKAVYGVEAEMWTEFINNFGHLCEMYFPRMAAVAERGWCGSDVPGYKSFVTRHEKLRSTVEKSGVTVIPVEKWSVSPLLRLHEIRKFFSGGIDIGTIVNSVNNGRSEK